MDNKTPTAQSLLPWSTIEDRELNRLRAADEMLKSLMDDMDGAVAAHDPEDTRHRSHGGQHTNGRCCAFGNLNPSAVGVFKRWLVEYRAFCK